MNETDDRLAGDPIWELFPSDQARPTRRWLVWVEMILLVAVTWWLAPPVAVVLAGGMASFGDFRAGRRIARTMADQVGGRVCARFTDAWGAWKVGATGFGMMFVVAIVEGIVRPGSKEVPPAALTALLLGMGGFIVAAILTAVGLVQTYRFGLRIWVGTGINQARTLLFAMLMVGFICLVLLPLCILLIAKAPDGNQGLVPFTTGLFAVIFLGPVIMLVLLDRFARRVVAERPASFGPKVPAVGKWQPGTEKDKRGSRGQAEDLTSARR